MNKTTLRQEMLSKRNALTKSEIHNKSNEILHKLHALSSYKNAHTIMVYVSFGSEVYTHDLIEKAIGEGKKVVIPVCQPDTKKLTLSHLKDLKEDLIRGYFGLLEPKKEALRPLLPNEVDLILVPGIAFTEDGIRLGYGGGYYDGFLASLSKSIPTIALAFEIQMVKALPVDSHDIPVNYILTEERYISCKS